MQRLVCALFLVPLIASCQQTFRIAGRIMQHGSKQPLKSLLVSMWSIEHRDVHASFLTAEYGNFAFESIPAGKYALEVQRRGGRQTLFQQNDTLFSAIAVGPGLDSEHIVFPLEAAAFISVSVMDEEGEPVPSAQITLFRKAVRRGKSQILSVIGRTADSSGTLRFGHLTAGTYFVAAVAHPWYAQMANRNQSNPRSALNVAYPVTYYADSVDPALASPVTLSEGGAATIQIVLRPVGAVGVVLTGFDGPNQGSTLFATGPGGSQIPLSASALARNDRQIITGIAPGRYTLVTQIFQGKREVLGQKVMDLASDSILNIHELPKRTAISGQVIVEGGGEFPSDQVGVQLLNVSHTFYMSLAKDRSLSLDDDTEFVPGRYYVQLTGAPGFYAKSVAVKGGKPSEDAIDIPDRAGLQISVIVVKGASRINGTAISNGKPAPGALVLLVPRDRSRIVLVRPYQTDTAGTFTLEDVPPGRYTLLAIDDGHDFAYAEPSVIKPYLSQGQTLDVPLRNDSQVKVNVAQRQQ